MIAYLKKNLWFIVFLAVFGLVGGYFTGVYTIQSTDPTLLEEAVAQLGSLDALILVTTIQSVGYAIFCGIVGRLLAEKLGLWRSVSFEARPTLSVILVSVFGGCALILSDIFFFNNFSTLLKDSYLVKPTAEYIIAALTYGGVIEEIMMRLFMMSLIAFILMKFSRRSEPTTAQLVWANIILATLFAAGHLPATVAMMEINAMIILRCFLLNGGIGLLFGRLYRRYGIQYAILAHMGVHIISKLIWLFFI